MNDVKKKENTVSSGILPENRPGRPENRVACGVAGRPKINYLSQIG
jgi:hypothetical protein